MAVKVGAAAVAADADVPKMSAASTIVIAPTLLRRVAPRRTRPLSRIPLLMGEGALPRNLEVQTRGQRPRAIWPGRGGVRVGAAGPCSERVGAAGPCGRAASAWARRGRASARRGR